MQESAAYKKRNAYQHIRSHKSVRERVYRVEREGGVHLSL